MEEARHYFGLAPGRDELMRIEVIQDDIDQGCPEDTGDCPVARALLRQVPSISGVLVDGAELVMRFPSFCVSVPTPGIVRDFIEQFDAGEHTEPFTFEFT